MLFWESSHGASCGVSWDQGSSLTHMALPAAAPSELEALGVPPPRVRGEGRLLRVTLLVLAVSTSLLARWAELVWPWSLLTLSAKVKWVDLPD